MSDDLVEPETMDSTPKVDNKMMASFRIDRDAWKRFGEMGRRERLTVTELITDYVEKCLAADRSWYGVEISTDKDDVSIDYSNIISTGNDIVLKQVEELISTHKDEILMLVEEKISMAISKLSLLHGSDTNNALSSSSPSLERARPEGEIKSPAAKSKPEGEPDWVTNETRTFYKRLAFDEELLSKVTAAIETYPNTSDLAREIVALGFCKTDGTPLGVDKMSRIRKVVRHLNTAK
jgi:hypothetical protein